MQRKLIAAIIAVGVIGGILAGVTVLVAPGAARWNSDEWYFRTLSWGADSKYPRLHEGDKFVAGPLRYYAMPIDGSSSEYLPGALP